VRCLPPNPESRRRRSGRAGFRLTPQSLLSTHYWHTALLTPPKTHPARLLPQTPLSQFRTLLQVSPALRAPAKPCLAPCRLAPLPAVLLTNESLPLPL
jgi:hypothetical protein